MINLLETQIIKNNIEANPNDVVNIIEKTNIGVCITDSQGNYAAVNDSYCKIYGYTKADLLGKSFLVVVPGDFHESMQVLHKKFLRDKREIAREWTVLTKSQKPIKISVDAAYSDKIFNKGPHKITFVQPEAF